MQSHLGTSEGEGEKIYSVCAYECVFVNTFMWQEKKEEKSKCVCQVVTIINIKTLLIFIETTYFVFQSFKTTGTNALRCDPMMPVASGCIVFNLQP